MVGAVLAVGMTLFSFASSVPVLLAAGIVYGLSIGINMPAIFAWTIDLAPAGKSATALSTMLMALEVGIGLGSVRLGVMVRFTAVDFAGVVWDVCGIWGAGFCVLDLVERRPQKRRFGQLITPVRVDGIHRASNLSFTTWRRFLKTTDASADRAQGGHG